VTRIYLQPDAIPDAVPEHRRHTLIARREGDGYRFEIRLQGPDETVFFDV
jgi:protocatechuate 3,4-dioxygenase alpha subunit